MDEDDQAQAKASVLQYQKTIGILESTPPAGRLVIHISQDVTRWANTSADIQVRAGDTIYVPKRSGIVLVDGSVYNPTGITYKPGKNAGWYLKQAGGPTAMAIRKASSWYGRMARLPAELAACLAAAWRVRNCDRATWWLCRNRYSRFQYQV